MQREAQLVWRILNRMLAWYSEEKSKSRIEEIHKEEALCVASQRSNKGRKASMHDSGAALRGHLDAE